MIFALCSFLNFDQFDTANVKQDTSTRLFSGLFSHSPVLLEWDMKLWWPHNEAMISFLMAYKETRDLVHIDRFAQVFDYCYKHVSIKVEKGSVQKCENQEFCIAGLNHNVQHLTFFSHPM